MAKIQQNAQRHARREVQMRLDLEMVRGRVKFADETNRVVNFPDMGWLNAYGHYNARHDLRDLLARVDELERVAADVANLLGGPTMNYSPEYESQERADRINKAVSMISAALSAAGMEK